MEKGKFRADIEFMREREKNVREKSENFASGVSASQHKGGTFSLSRVKLTENLR